MGETSRTVSRAVSERSGGARILVAVLVAALCAIVYELSIATVGSYFLGNTVLQFSVTIGVFLTALGIGAAASRLASRPSLETFIGTELAVALLGGCGIPFLMWAYGRQPGLFAACMYGYTVVIGVLLGLELPLASHLLRDARGVNAALSVLLTLDYAGSLVGSLLFPLLLLPTVGLVRTGMCMALLNVAVAAWLGLAPRLTPVGNEHETQAGSRARDAPGAGDPLTSHGIFGAGSEGTTGEPSLDTSGHPHRFPPAVKPDGAGHVPQPLLLAAMAIAAALIGGLIVADPLANALSQQLYRDPVILSVQSSYQSIAVTRLHDDVRLFLDGQLQFSSLDEYRYHEALVHPAMGLAASRGRVLVLGGGDGLAAKQALSYPDVRSLTLVELDPAVIRLFRDQPLLRSLNSDSLRSDRIHVVNEDATTYLQGNADLYDVIIADFPDPRDPSLERLYTTELYRLIRRHLAADGAFVTQATSPFFAPRAFWCIEATVGTVWPNARGYHVDVPSFGDWGFVLASAVAPDPSRLAPRVPTRFLSPSVLSASFAFGDDVLAYRDDVRPNTLVQPVLAGYYGQGWRR